MASIAKDKNGTRRLSFTGNDGKRHYVRLGKINAKVGEAIRARVESILACQAARLSLDRETAQWLGDIPNTLRTKLAACGLIDGEQIAGEISLADFLADLKGSRGDIKATTNTVHGQTRRNLLACFDGRRAMRSFTRKDGDAFRVYLLSEVGENTARRRCGHATEFFTTAIRRNYLPRTFENPFTHLPSSVLENTARLRFIEREVIDKNIASCRCPQWRCLIALGRYAGMRVPSEPISLRRSDIDWKAQRIMVTVPKMSHLPNKATRLIPLFPELVQPLRDAIAAGGDSEWVITRYRETTANLGPEMLRVIRRAGVTPWPKPWQNLRATRETELADRFPIHVVCAWIGNSPDVAVKHYMQLRPHHFDAAVAQVCAQSAAVPAYPLASPESGNVVKPSDQPPTSPRVIPPDVNRRS